MPRHPRDASGRGAPVTLYLAPAERDKLREEAERREISMSALVGELIRKLRAR